MAPPPNNLREAARRLRIEIRDNEGIIRDCRGYRDHLVPYWEEKNAKLRRELAEVEAKIAEALAAGRDVGLAVEPPVYGFDRYGRQVGVVSPVLPGYYHVTTPLVEAPRSVRGVSGGRNYSVHTFEHGVTFLAYRLGAERFQHGSGPQGSIDVTEIVQNWLAVCAKAREGVRGEARDAPAVNNGAEGGTAA